MHATEGGRRACPTLKEPTRSAQPNAFARNDGISAAGSTPPGSDRHPGLDLRNSDPTTACMHDLHVGVLDRLTPGREDSAHRVGGAEHDPSAVGNLSNGPGSIRSRIFPRHVAVGRGSGRGPGGETAETSRRNELWIQHRPRRVRGLRRRSAIATAGATWDHRASCDS